MSTHIDFIIVGQGIAGSFLSWNLINSGKKVLVIDDPNSTSASQVASGIINPVTGKRIVKTWLADELLTFARKAYSEIEEKLKIKVCRERIITRIFSNPEDQYFFLQKKEAKGLPENIQFINKFPSCFHEIKFGGIEIAGALQIDYPVLLRRIRQWLVEKNSVLDEHLDPAELQVDEQRIRFRNYKAGMIIFCEGALGATNHFFPQLSFNLVKGEILTVKIKGMPSDKIWHRGIFIAPLGDDLFNVGSTYDWNFTDPKQTEAGRQLLEKKLKKAINLNFEIVDHRAAVRPAVADRRPILGRHSQFSRIGIFNGLGTKGASLAPYFSKHLTEFLLYGKPLIPEVNIERFKGDLI